MDRNKVMAIVFTCILVFGYLHYFGPKPQPKPSTFVVTNVVSSTGTPFSGSKVTQGEANSVVIPRTINAPTATIENQETLANELINYTFSEFGGDIYSIVLEKSDVVLKGPYCSILAPSNNWQVPLRLEKLGQYGVDNLIMTVSKKTESSLIYTGTISNKFIITKKYQLQPNSYLLFSSIIISNISDQTVEFEKGISMWLGPIKPATVKKDRYSIRKIDVSVAGEKEGSYDIERIKSGKKDDAKIIAGPVQWLDSRNKYYTHILIPEQNSFVAKLWSEGPKSNRRITGTTTYLSPPLISGAALTLNTALYAGPKDYTTLEELGKSVNKGSNYTKIMDLGMFAFLAKPILIYGLKGLYKYVHNYGIAIIIVTLLIKIITWPLTTKSVLSMKKMGLLQPEMKLLRVKYKDEPQKMQQETMLLYRKHGVNPVSGCLPMLLQFPIFLALYAALSRAIELHGASFLWIKDLSLPDNVYNFPFYIPFFGDKAAGVTGLHPLAIAMGVAMVVQQMLTPKSGDKSQQRMMMIMPVVFIVIFYNMPSGLVLYWFFNQVISIGQMYYLHYIKK